MIVLWLPQFLGLQYQFEFEFGNPSFETPEKQNVFNFSVNLFLSSLEQILNFILLLCTSLKSETWSFELISQLLFFVLSTKRKFSNSFQNCWKPEKIYFKAKKGIFFYRATVCRIGRSLKRTEDAMKLKEIGSVIWIFCPSFFEPRSIQSHHIEVARCGISSRTRQNWKCSWPI